MKLSAHKKIKTLLYIGIVCAIVTMQGMEYQEENDYSSFLETLCAAEKADDQQLCAELFSNFRENLAQKEVVEQVSIVTDLTQQAAQKNERITLVFCRTLESIFNENLSLAPILQDLISPLIPVLKHNKQIIGLEKLACIFADNFASEEYQTIQHAIQNKFQHATLDTSQDEVIATMLAHENSSNDDELFMAIQASLQANNNPSSVNNDGDSNTAIIHREYYPSAPTLEELGEEGNDDDFYDEEENELSIAIEKSLQNQKNRAATFTSFLRKMYEILLGGFGS